MFESKPTFFPVIVLSEIWDSQMLTMTSRHHFPAELRWRAIGWLKAGQSQTEVARWLNGSPFVTLRPWKQFQTTNWASRRFGQGQATAKTSADEQYLILCACRNSTATLTLLRSSLTAAIGRLVSMSTERRRLHEGGLHARRPAICVPLTSRHRRDLLQGARQHVH